MTQALLLADDYERLIGLRRQLEALKKIRNEWPIAAWEAWTGERSRGCTDQSGAMLDLGELVTCFFGGNRSGKTELVRALIVAFALGSDHPAVIVWAAANGFDLEQIPVGPGRCWLIALTSSDSKRYHRKHVLRLLPDGARIRSWNMSGRGEAHIEIEVPGYDRPAEIFFKSADQGPRGMQGDECRAIGIDEECDIEVFQEAEMRVGSEPLRMFISMTPLKGLTWVYDRFVADNADGVKCHWLDALSNPHLPTATREQLRRKYATMTPEQVAARRFGQFLTIEGRVYVEWSREVHVIDPFPIPPAWPRVRVMDFGLRNPTAVLWAAISPDDQLVIYREHRQAGWSLSRHAAHILQAEGWVHAEGDAIEREAGMRGWRRPQHSECSGRGCQGCFGGTTAEKIGRAWADPSGRQQIVDMRTTHGLFFRPASNAVDAGINDVVERLHREPLEMAECEECGGAGRADDGGGDSVIVLCHQCGGRGRTVTQWGPPGLTVFKGLTHFIREIEGYVHPKKRGRADPSERPLKRDDHLMDALRYLCRGVRRGQVEVS